MFDGLEILQSNVTIGRMWLNQMARGLYENSILLQQCTSYPRHVLAGLEMGLVTQVPAWVYDVPYQRKLGNVTECDFHMLHFLQKQRVSMDFALSKDNWKIGISSLWVSALGQRPFKDIFRAEGREHSSTYPLSVHSKFMHKWLAILQSPRDQEDKSFQENSKAWASLS